jgi:predicted extracellular nuclease
MLTADFICLENQTSDMKKKYFVLVLSLFVFVTGAAAQKNRLISDIQGEKNTSLYVGENVRVSGIVTARTRTGFFLQTPDNKVDNNPNTSEGIFVFTKT